MAFHTSHSRDFKAFYTLEIQGHWVAEFRKNSRRAQHAAMESAIREHKNGFGVEKLPTQKFHANWAYLLIVQLAFNLVSWFKRLVLPASYHRSTVKTIRH